SKTAPDATVTALVWVVLLPKPFALVMRNVPALILVASDQALVLESASVPEPTLVNARLPDSPIAPLMVNRLLALETPMLVAPVKVIAPFKLLLPAELISTIAPVPPTPVPVTDVMLLA